MKVKILKPIGEMSESLGRYIEYKAGEIAELEDERAISLAKIGLVEIIVEVKEEVKEEKSFEEPPRDKMIRRAKKR